MYDESPLHYTLLDQITQTIHWNYSYIDMQNASIPTPVYKLVRTHFSYTSKRLARPQLYRPTC